MEIVKAPPLTCTIVQCTVMVNVIYILLSKQIVVIASSYLLHLEMKCIAELQQGYLHLGKYSLVV